jgi:uncharacterized protein with gpF-like domain
MVATSAAVKTQSSGCDRWIWSQVHDPRIRPAEAWAFDPISRCPISCAAT